MTNEIEKQTFKLRRLVESNNSKIDAGERVCYSDHSDVKIKEKIIYIEKSKKYEQELSALREEKFRLLEQKYELASLTEQLCNESEKLVLEHEYNLQEITKLIESDFILALSHKKNITTTVCEMDRNLQKILDHLASYLQLDENAVEYSQNTQDNSYRITT